MTGQAGFNDWNRFLTGSSYWLLAQFGILNSFWMSGGVRMVELEQQTVLKLMFWTISGVTNGIWLLCSVIEMSYCYNYEALLVSLIWLVSVT